MTSKWPKRLAKLKGLFWQGHAVVLLRFSSWNTARLKRQIQARGVKQLHVGCGHILLEDWLNVTFEPKQEYGRMKEHDRMFYLNYNLLTPWPVAEESMTCIAASHFIEHFDLNAGIDFVNHCYRVLKTGGIIRLSCPDLELYAQRYVARDSSFFTNEKIRAWCAFKKACTPGEIFIAKAYDSGGSHKWFYDFDSLQHILAQAGFVNIRRVGRLEGKTPDLDKLELAERELETVYIEAEKNK